MNLKRNLFYNFLLSASQVLLPLVSIPYISRILDPAGVGSVNFIDSLTYYFISIAEFGIVVYGIREVARVRSDKVRLAKLVSELLTLHFITSAITIFIYSLTIFFLWQRIQDVRLIMFSFSFLLVNAFACEWYYWGTEKFGYITIRSLITRIAGLCSIFILIKQPQHYYIYYGIIAVSAMLNIFWNFGHLCAQLRISFKNADWKKHISKTWVTYCVSLLYSISVMLDNVLLGLVSTAAFVGFYSFSIKLVRLSAVALTDSLMVFFPHTVALRHNNEMEKFQRVILQSVRLITLFSVPISAGIFLLSEEITRIFFGPAFQRIAVDLKVLSIIPFLKCYNLFLSKQVLMSYDKERLYMQTLFISGLLFILSTIILSFFFNDLGACYAMVLYEISLVVFNYVHVKKTDKRLVVFDYRAFAHSVMGALLFIPLVFYFRQWVRTDGPGLGIIIITCAVFYVLFQANILKNELMMNLQRSAFRIVRAPFKRNMHL